MKVYTISTIFLIFIKLSSSDISSEDIIVLKPHQASNVLRVLKYVARDGNESMGIFQRFLKKFFDVLINEFSEKRLLKYMKVLSKSLSNMSVKYTKYLSSLCDKIYAFDDDIKDVLRMYRAELNKTLPERVAFLKAMDKVFNLQQDLQFDDYIQDLKDYGNKDKLYIDHETKKIVRKVIVDIIFELPSKERRSLHKKLNRAVKEYKNDEKAFIIEDFDSESYSDISGSSDNSDS